MITGIAVIILILITVILTWMGFRNNAFLNKQIFEIEQVRKNKRYSNIISSGFVHVNWWQLLLNMYSLYFFGTHLSERIGEPLVLLVYFVSLAGGNLITLYLHRKHDDYSSLGANGAVAGVMFTALALSPEMEVDMLGVLQIPGWIYAVVYILLSLYAIRSKKYNIGHETHLAGALCGLALALALFHNDINYLMLAAMLLPCICFIYIVVTRPYLLYISNNFFQKHYRYVDIDDQYRMDRATRAKKVDAILEKIQARGIESLSAEERRILEDHSSRL
ncbi:membrane associated rhomboid family serine protease [Chitinophaga dinghuensis]|uniref:Membrane associated rhomboid family serine protease n=1 Tax=Chitinophaga dinghuensis TaxID=1539050 RepID=A0A327W441_9BACT|nr:rhomboid family intramembrane serine protease [Chitinophaga dinghuensis]RAJ83140.1 membrane associated rhomboid family serine protease [Chitinophaga dinghuensis]